MHFNADAYRTNIAPPSITLAGRTFTGRLLSLEQWMPLQHMIATLKRQLRANQSEERVESARDAYIAQARVKAAFKQLTAAMFPHPAWKVWEPSVASLLAREPMAVQEEAVKSFIQSQETSLRRQTTPATPPTTSTETR